MDSGEFRHHQHGQQCIHRLGRRVRQLQRRCGCQVHQHYRRSVIAYQSKTRKSGVRTALFLLAIIPLAALFLKATSGQRSEKRAPVADVASPTASNESAETVASPAAHVPSSIQMRLAAAQAESDGD